MNSDTVTCLAIVGCYGVDLVPAVSILIDSSCEHSLLSLNFAVSNAVPCTVRVDGVVVIQMTTGPVLLYFLPV